MSFLTKNNITYVIILAIIGLLLVKSPPPIIGDSEVIPDLVVDDQSDHKVVRRILYFGTDWCVPCRKEHKVVFPKLVAAGWKIDETENSNIQLMPRADAQDVVSQYNLKNYPTFILLEDGKEIQRQEGFMDQWQIGTFMTGNKQTINYMPSIMPNGVDYFRSKRLNKLMQSNNNIYWYYIL